MKRSNRSTIPGWARLLREFALSILLMAVAGCWQNEAEQLKNKLKKQRSENQSLQENVNQLTQQVDKLSKQIKKRDHEIKSLKADVLAARGSEANTQQMCAEQTKQLKTELETLKQEKSRQEEQNALDTCRHEATAVIHYHRPDGKYHQWGLHLWGDAVVEPTSWSDPRMFNEKDPFGMYAKVPLRPDSLDKELWFIIHREATKSVNKDLFFVPKETAEVWLIHGDATIYTSLKEANEKLKKK